MRKYSTLILSIGILSVFLARTILAMHFTVPYTFEVFELLTILGSIFVVWQSRQHLSRSDWILALVLGILIGVEMGFATLFSPYPFFGVVKTSTGQAILRGAFTTIAVLGGLAIMRQGGPVTFSLANGDWNRAGRSVLLGLVVGLPLAVINVFALQITIGQGILWQSPLAALSDAIQPGIVEEVIYRFALWGLLWLLLRTSHPEKADRIAGLLAMLVHNYSHFDDMFMQSPLTALGVGVVLVLFWGLPLMILAHRKGLESAIAFHWIQDTARFIAGY